MEKSGVPRGVNRVTSNFYWSAVTRNIWIRRIVRIVVGALFLYAGSIKVVDIGGFARQVMAYDILPWEVVNLFSIWIITIEIIAGILLITGVWARPAAFIIAGLCLIFIIAITSALARGIPLRCGCFSAVPSSEPRTWISLWRESALFIAALYLFYVARSGEQG